MRAIYEAYVRWFDAAPASLYPTFPGALFPESVPMTGGPEAVAREVPALIRKGDPGATGGSERPARADRECDGTRLAARGNKDESAG